VLERRGSVTSLRAALARVPAAAWMCALIAFLNGAAWSIITPPFQGRDEPAHFAYVQLLAETGTLPRSATEHSGFSPEEALVLEGLHQYEVKLAPQNPAISSTSEQRALTQDVNEGLSPVGSGKAGVATSEPPLYYAIEAVPYAMGAGNTLAALELMRLAGALLAAITALLTFFFLREVLPGVPWAATVGAACVAVQPLFGFMSGTVNPDTMLYAVSAALFLCLGRGFRRGLTPRLSITIGVLIAVGFVTKLNFVGLAFGALAGLILLGVRETRSKGPGALRSLAIALGIGLSPVLLYMLVNGVSNHPILGSASAAAPGSAGQSIFHEIGYVWEFYLPRLPGMVHYFAGVSTFRDIWFNRFVGLYGWIDTEFPVWVDNVALVLAAAIALLCGRALIVRRTALRARLPELAIYAAMGIGVLLLVGAASYSSRIATGGVEGFGDPRYLLPMLPLLGAVLTLAVRGTGRRWAPAAGAVILVVFLAHDIFSQLQVIARYYG
jgi:4-amino-4-deoxy-L-arabinose transferase-like glycosyltransferase